MRATSFSKVALLVRLTQVCFFAMESRMSLRQTEWSRCIDNPALLQDAIAQIGAQGCFCEKIDLSTENFRKFSLQGDHLQEGNGP